MIEKFYNEKIKKWATDICHILESVTAVFVLLGVLIALIGMIPVIGEFWANRGSAEEFLEFLEKVSVIVVGVEFMKMLCRPNSDNVLETIIFLVARHMIVVHTSTPLEDLISTVSIILLCYMRRYLKEGKERDRAFQRLFKKKQDAMAENLEQVIEEKSQREIQE